MEPLDLSVAQALNCASHRFELGAHIDHSGYSEANRCQSSYDPGPVTVDHEVTRGDVLPQVRQEVESRHEEGERVHERVDTDEPTVSRVSLQVGFGWDAHNSVTRVNRCECS